MQVTMRKPSHLLSKIQAASSKGASVSVASMGCRRLGSFDSRAMASATRKRATMNIPHRVQLRRIKGWRMPDNTLKVDRTTLFGNPFLVSEYGHDRAVALHRAWVTGEPLPGFPDRQKKELARRRREVLAALGSLRGRNL